MLGSLKHFKNWLILPLIFIFYVLFLQALVPTVTWFLGILLTMYGLFLIFHAGICYATSETVREYDILGDRAYKEKVFFTSKRLSLLFGLISSLIFFVLGQFFVNYFDVEGLLPREIQFFFGILSFLVLFRPLCSAYRGYFLGHRLIKRTMISYWLEFGLPLFVMFVLLILSFFISLSIPTKTMVFMLTILLSSALSFFYLFFDYKKQKVFQKGTLKIQNKFTIRSFLKNVFFRFVTIVLLPFFMIFYHLIDLIWIYDHVKNVQERVETLSVVGFSGLFLNLILWIFLYSLIVKYHLTLEKQYKTHQKSFVKVFQQQFLKLISILFPIVILMGIIAVPFFLLLYGKSSTVFSLYSILIWNLFGGLLLAYLINFLLLIKKSHFVFFLLLLQFLFHIFLKTSFVATFQSIGFSFSASVLLSTIWIYFISSIVAWIPIYRYSKEGYDSFFKCFFDILLITLIFAIVLLLFKNVYFHIFLSSNVVWSLIFIGIICVFAHYLYRFLLKIFQISQKIENVRDKRS